MSDPVADDSDEASQHRKTLGRVDLFHASDKHALPAKVPGIDSGSALVEWYRG